MTVRALALVGAVSLLGCSKPVPPKITPESVEVTGVSTSALDLDLSLTAENTNAIDLDAESVAATVTVGGDQEVGKVVITHKVHLPAGKTTRMTVPMSVKWTDLPALASIASKGKAISFTVEGTVQVGGALSIKVPFTVDGSLTKAQMLTIALKSVPKIPGLSLP